LNVDLQELYKAGARKFLVYGFPPLGCLPAEITVAGRVGPSEVGCEEDLNQIGIDHNIRLLAAFSQLRSDLPGIRILYGDSYTYLYEAFNNPSKYGTHLFLHPSTKFMVFFQNEFLYEFLIDILLLEELDFNWFFLILQCQIIGF